MLDEDQNGRQSLLQTAAVYHGRRQKTREADSLMPYLTMDGGEVPALAMSHSQPAP